MTTSANVGMSPDPTASADQPSPPSIWGMMGAPAATFSALAEAPRARPALRWLILTLPLLPIVVAVGSYGSVHDALSNNSALASRSYAAPFIGIFVGIVVLGLQLAMLTAHLALFALLARWMRTPRRGSEVVAVWAYSMFPLLLRQTFLIVLLGLQGPDWLRDHGALLSFLDPFVMWIGVLFWIGCRRVLELDRYRSTVVAALVSVVGMLGGISALGG